MEPEATPLSDQDKVTKPLALTDTRPAQADVPPPTPHLGSTRSGSSGSLNSNNSNSSSNLRSHLCSRSHQLLLQPHLPSPSSRPPPQHRQPPQHQSQRESQSVVHHNQPHQSDLTDPDTLVVWFQIKRAAPSGAAPAVPSGPTRSVGFTDSFADWEHNAISSVLNVTVDVGGQTCI